MVRYAARIVCKVAILLALTLLIARVHGATVVYAFELVRCFN